MSISSVLRDEMSSVLSNLKTREWIQGSERDGEKVCAHGAVMTCEGLQPGDQWIIRAVMRTKGVTEDWNDQRGRTKEEVVARMSLIEVTDADLFETFGPSWCLVVAVIRRAAQLTSEEADRLDAAWDAARDAARDAAWDAARAAARDAARDAAWDAAWDAARAAAVADLVGQHGLTQQHIDTLMAPWVAALGADWADGVQR